ncbi:MAG: HIT family protein [Anaerolineales bacterium]
MSANLDLPPAPEAYKPDCFICCKQREKAPPPGGWIYADDLVMASHANLKPDSGDQYLGWVVLETRRHTPDLASLSDEEAQRIGLITSKIASALKNELEAEKIYSFVIGERVAHFHLHLLPRYPNTPQEYWGARVNEWPGAARGSEPELTALCSRLRSRLAPPG